MFKRRKIYLHALLAALVFGGLFFMTIARQAQSEELICTTEYSPVCGVDNKTYSNECKAKQAGVDISYEGQCKEQKCSDGTLYDKCSETKPKYCGQNSAGEYDLADKCSVCGCPTDETCQANGSCAKEEVKEAYFKFDDPPGKETFIIKLTDYKKIQNARDILTGKITDATQIMGKIVKKPVDYNTPWNYYLEPSSVNFFEVATEVCDASIPYVEDHLKEACGAFLPECMWCPWGSRLIAEVSAKDIKKPDLIVENISLSPKNPFEYEFSTITIKGKNIGNASIDSCHFGGVMNDQLDFEVTTTTGSCVATTSNPILNPGDSFYFIYKGYHKKSGSMKIYFDLTLAVGTNDSDKNNNSLSRDITVYSRTSSSNISNNNMKNGLALIEWTTPINIVSYKVDWREYGASNIYGMIQKDLDTPSKNNSVIIGSETDKKLIDGKDYQYTICNKAEGENRDYVCAWPVKFVYSSQNIKVLSAKNDVVDNGLEKINNTAKKLNENKFDSILSELKVLKDAMKEQQAEIKYLKILKQDVKKLSAAVESAINNFITYGVDENTKKLGAGERSAVMHSYKAAFAKLPETEEELSDAIKIANGRWPSITNEKAEKKAKEQFQKIYKRIPDMEDAKDNAAVTVMAYGLRQRAENRNLNSEKAGINIFKGIYKKLPSTTEEWNIMQAITYSGAAREADMDGDLLPDWREDELGTDKNKKDTDGDGYSDGVEVLNGFDPLKK